MNTHGVSRSGTDGGIAYNPYPAPFNQGFTNGLYAITGATNVGKLILPTGFLFQQFEPGLGTSLRLCARVEATVTNFSLVCSRANFLPTLPQHNAVFDERLAHARHPVPVVGYRASPGLLRAGTPVATRLPKTSKKASPVVVALFVVAQVVVLCSILLRQAKTKA